MTGLGQLFRSTEEQVEPQPAQVIGEIPGWLNGSYLRVGPGVFDVNDFSVNHWCDGFAVVYKFHIQDGQVTFMKKIIQSDAYKKAQAVGRPVFTELGTKAYTDTKKNIFQKMVSNVIPDLTDNVGCNLFKLGNSVYLATESCNMRILDVESLNTDKKVDMSQYVSLNRLCSHFYTDQDGTGYTMGSAFTNSFKCQVVKIPPNNSGNNECKKATNLCTIPNRLSNCSSYAHSFGFTEKYIIYIEQPMFVNNMKLMTAHLKGKSLLECMDWNPEESTRFILVNKENGKTTPIIYESNQPFFFLHVVNCYEKQNEMVVDVICHDSPEVMEKLYLKYLRKEHFEIKDQASCRRYILPLAEDIKELKEGENLVKVDARVKAYKLGDRVVITGHTMTEPNYDLPTVNKAYIGKEYRYFYAAGLFGDSKFQGSLLKVDVRSGDVLVWKEHNEVIPGEAVFVPRPGAEAEDDGILLIGVTDTRPAKNSFLLVLQASNLQEIARAHVQAHELKEGENLVKVDARVKAYKLGDRVVITGHTMTEPNYDLPTVNKAYIGKEYRYFYAAGLFGDSKFQGSLLKVDVRSGDVLVWKEHNEVIPGEAVFVPRPGAEAEDDGILLIGVTDTRPAKNSFLLVLQASNLQEIARAHVQAHVPHLLHALFLTPNC